MLKGMNVSPELPKMSSKQYKLAVRRQNQVFNVIFWLVKRGKITLIIEFGFSIFSDDEMSDSSSDSSILRPVSDSEEENDNIVTGMSHFVIL